MSRHRSATSSERRAPVAAAHAERLHRLGCVAHLREPHLDVARFLEIGVEECQLASVIALKGTNTLKVQGCAFGGMFCGGQTWKRVS